MNGPYKHEEIWSDIQQVGQIEEGSENVQLKLQFNNAFIAHKKKKVLELNEKLRNAKLYETLFVDKKELSEQ